MIEHKKINLKFNFNLILKFVEIENDILVLKLKKIVNYIIVYYKYIICNNYINLFALID